MTEDIFEDKLKPKIAFGYNEKGLLPSLWFCKDDIFIWGGVVTIEDVPPEVRKLRDNWVIVDAKHDVYGPLPDDERSSHAVALMCEIPIGVDYPMREVVEYLNSLRPLKTINPPYYGRSWIY